MSSLPTAYPLAARVGRKPPVAVMDAAGILRKEKGADPSMNSATLLN